VCTLLPYQSQTSPVNPILINSHYYLASLTFPIKENPWQFAPHSNKYIFLLGLPTLPVRGGHDTVMPCAPLWDGVGTASLMRRNIYSSIQEQTVLSRRLDTHTRARGESRLSLFSNNITALSNCFANRRLIVTKLHTHSQIPIFLLLGKSILNPGDTTAIHESNSS